MFIILIIVYELEEEIGSRKLGTDTRSDEWMRYITRTTKIKSQAISILVEIRSIMTYRTYTHVSNIHYINMLIKN